MQTTWTVTELTSHVKQLLENDQDLRGVLVKGEISNANLYPSGHLYFTLKDSDSQISCVMFSAKSRLPLFMKDIKDGMKVIASGRITLYEKRGQYQLQVESLTLDGLGELYRAFQELKEKLQKEGLFDETVKRPLPVYPKSVGLVTSPAGAAVHDMVSIIKRRNPAMDIILSPAIVQGEEAPNSLIRALKLLWQLEEIDVIIIGRGGGSLEDLWAFNSEELARTIRQSRVPIVSAVGHETDFTISDLAADKRAPTPSGAAELVAPDRNALHKQILSNRQYIMTLLERRVAKEKTKLDLLQGRRPFKFPFDQINKHNQRLDELTKALRHGLIGHISHYREQLGTLRGKLEALSPLAVLSRGYCLCETIPDHKLIKSAATPSSGQPLALRFADGEVKCTVSKKPSYSKEQTKASCEQLLLKIDA